MIQYLKRYLSKYKWYYLIGCLMVIAKTLVASMIPQYVQLAVDSLARMEETAKIYEYIFILLALSLIQGGFLFAMRRITIGASRYIENDLRNDFYKKIISLDMNFFHHHRTGDLMARASNDMGNVRTVFGPAIMYTVNLLFSFIVYLSMMLQISPRLTFWACLPIPIMGLAVYYLGQITYKKQQVIQSLYSGISTFAQENLAGHRVVKSFGLETDQSERFSKLNHDYFTKMMNFITINSLFYPIIYFIISLGVAALLYVGGNEVIAGTLSIGELTAFILYLGLLTWPAIAVGWVASLYQTGNSSLQRIHEIFLAESTLSDSVKDDKKNISGSIEIRSLNFSYPNSNQEIISDISLQMKAGSSLGIVGPVGSGKSTLLHLLNRGYQVADNCIFLDGIDINQYSVSNLNRQISMVPQESFLFSDSIENNIRFFSDVNDADINEAIKKSSLHEVINDFEHGKKTVLGERGVNLSGGQKQRVAIARAMVKQCPVLILDDCLSAVDNETEHEILQSFRNERKKRSLIIVSHRLSSVQDCDHIIYLENGRIIEEGNHSELLEINGRYAQLFEKQKLEEELREIL